MTRPLRLALYALAAVLMVLVVTASGWVWWRILAAAFKCS